MSRHSSRASLDCKIYVGDLPKDATEKEIERAFDEFGPIKSVWVARNPSGFAFVEFDDPRDAEDAVKSLDGQYICGARAKVEFSTGKSKSKPWQQQQQHQRRPQESRSGRRGFDPDDRCYECGERGHYAYDCEIRLKRGGRRRSSSRSRGRRDRRSRTRSRSRDRSRNRSPARKYSRSRSPTPRRRSRSRDRSASRGGSRGGSRGRSPGSDK